MSGRGGTAGELMGEPVHGAGFCLDFGHTKTSEPLSLPVEPHLFSSLQITPSPQFGSLHISHQVHKESGSASRNIAGALRITLCKLLPLSLFLFRLNLASSSPDEAIRSIHVHAKGGARAFIFDTSSIRPGHPHRRAYPTYHCLRQENKRVKTRVDVNIDALCMYRSICTQVSGVERQQKGRSIRAQLTR